MPETDADNEATPDDLELARAFEEHRTRLRAIAYRMLGSVHEADDAVQEAYLRLHRTDGIENLGAWLTTVVSRICLDMLRSRASRREDDLGDDGPAEQVQAIDEPGHPEHEAVLADQVGSALLVVLESLAPAERLAFVLHDLFAVPFEEVATVIGRSPAATRQLASRARRRVQGAPEPDGSADRRIVDAFLTAARGGDLTTLLSVLDPDAAIRPDKVAALMGGDNGPGTIIGGAAVAHFFNGAAQAAHNATLDGFPGAMWMHRGEVKVAFNFVVENGLIVEIELIGDPEILGAMEIVRSKRSS